MIFFLLELEEKRKEEKKKAIKCWKGGGYPLNNMIYIINKLLNY